MAVIKELIRGEVNGAVSFGNYKLKEKGKVEDFNHEGNLYKVKTFNTMTKLEKNGLFLYESVPGTSAINFKEDENGVSFFVTGDGDVQITVGLEEDTEYEVFVEEKITLEQAKAQIEEKNIEILNRTIMQLKIKRGKDN